MLKPPDVNSSGLQHTLKQRHMTMIALGGVIGAGLFVGSRVVARSAGPAVILSFLLTGGLMVFIMCMLGEMASSMPVVGSFYEYARLAFEEHPSMSTFLGFMSGWKYWFFPYLTYFTIAAIIVVLAAMGFSDDQEQQLSLWFGLASVMLLAMIYWVNNGMQKRCAVSC